MTSLRSLEVITTSDSITDDLPLPLSSFFPFHSSLFLFPPSLFSFSSSLSFNINFSFFSLSFSSSLFPRLSFPFLFHFSSVFPFSPFLCLFSPLTFFNLPSFLFLPSFPLTWFLLLTQSPSSRFLYANNLIFPSSFSSPFFASCYLIFSLLRFAVYPTFPIHAIRVSLSYS